MFLRTCARYSKTYVRNISTNVNKILYNKMSPESLKFKSRTTLNYLASIVILATGLAYAAVPMYRLFCQAFSYGGTVSVGHDPSKIENIKPNKRRLITVKFNADTAAQMAWDFHPQQSEITVAPGETALAFYTATNPSDNHICGVSTYNVVPFEAGQYFNKIQCFCFEEQMLGPHEQVDMPVFFYIDPEFAEDPKLEYVNNIVLSYTFFESRQDLNSPLLDYIKKVH